MIRWGFTLKGFSQRRHQTLEHVKPRQQKNTGQSDPCDCSRVAFSHNDTTNAHAVKPIHCSLS